MAFVISGGLFLAMAFGYGAEGGGLGNSLDAIRDAPFGAILLGTTAIGLLCFAVYSFVETAYRRFV